MIKRIILFLILLLPVISFSQLTDKDKDIVRQELSERVNNLRISLRLKPLIFNDTLQKAAEFHSVYMAENDVLSHDEKKSKYRTPKKRVIAFKGKDFEIVGENALYSTPQSFPLNKKELIELAEEMFNSWKNSPGHYANMTEPEYVFGDLGFKTNLKKRVVYATQVFGTKGFVVENQISNNAFGLMKAAKDCEKEYASYSNLILSLGNCLKIEGKDVVLYYHDIQQFKRIFSNPKDGIAIDLVSKEQIVCGKPNELDFNPIYDGILLKPFYSAEMIANNSANGNYRIITKVGEIPSDYDEEEYSTSIILIKNGKACKYIYPAEISGKEYKLRPFEPTIKDDPTVDLQKEGVIRSQTVDYNFSTNITKALVVPLISKYSEPIHSVNIISFSSVEGDSVHNEKLHNSRAAFIKNHITRQLQVPKGKIQINAQENWKMMDFQLNYFERDELTKISHDSLKSFLATEDNSLPWDSLLYSQRRATATINYQGQYIDSLSFESIGEFNLRTAVVANNPRLANKALYSMYESLEYDPSILFEPQIAEFFNSHPETVANYSALLSFHYYFDPYSITSFLHNWLERSEKLDSDASCNLLHLYTLVGTYLLDNWDVSSERISNVIHPLKVQKFRPAKMKDELVLNLHLTFIQYFGQVNDSPNISKSFYFISDYFKTRSLDPKDDVDLALFFNNWSMYNMTVKHLLSRFESNKVNEDGVFLLAQAMNFTNYGDESGKYVEVHQKALETNQERWCEWVNVDFQIKRNYRIKRLYCESCK